MKKIYIPGELPKDGNLLISISVGQQGFKRSEFLKAGHWKPGAPFYVDEDATSALFSVGIKCASRKVEEFSPNLR